MKIRREQLEDHPAVATVHRSAFAGTASGEPDEVLLVERLRDGSWWLPWASLVALSPSDEVIGHVIATRAFVGSTDTPALGVGPLGVVPRWQRRGAGSALMHALLGAAEAQDERLVGLLGEPGFYHRFGFVAAAEYGIVPPDPRWGAAFQARLLAGLGTTGGAFRYAAPFDLVS